MPQSETRFLNNSLISRRVPAVRQTGRQVNRAKLISNHREGKDLLICMRGKSHDDQQKMICNQSRKVFLSFYTKLISCAFLIAALINLKNRELPDTELSIQPIFLR
ncbi:uncharacterized protein FA14DRAFT_159223 [Meira miltonrushii]|uniref:Uncharacterized protein n=1 Tax=Meira miltonrushii TaxID=1280837 RepID=A0A316VLJ0_9BASI|nr:uncharacterized protein FA14DRAFT_159223 [Meira miltonrushii]PWN36951.1 hypothetical protein FA14DRAFT_159223 [Meira miltonrushii]